MLPRADLNGPRPVTYVEAPTPVTGGTDARQEVYHRLAQIAIGQKLDAQVLQRLADGSFMVRIADTSARMMLPVGTKVGDTLKMTLVEQSPRPGFALDQEPDLPTGDARATLSNAGRLIDRVLHANRQGATPAVVGREPVLPAPAAGSSQVAAALQDTVNVSGLFYESHLAEWVEGGRSLPALMREPQAQMSSMQKSGIEAILLRHLAQQWAASGRPLQELVGQLQARTGGALTPNAEALSQPRAAAAYLNDLIQQWSANSRPLSELVKDLQARTGNLLKAPAEALVDPRAAESYLNRVMQQWTASGRSVLELMPQSAPDGGASNALASDMARATLVDQALQQPLTDQATQLINSQLHTLEHQRFIWHGELWPGQPLEWEVDREGGEGNPGDPEQQTWNSAVRFELPTLGAISASIRLVGNHVSIFVKTDNDEVATTLRAHGGELAQALQDAGSPLDALIVKRNGQA